MQKNHFTEKKLPENANLQKHGMFSFSFNNFEELVSSCCLLLIQNISDLCISGCN